MPITQTTIDDFEKIKIAVGRVLSADEFPEARKPAYKLEIDFGPLGKKRSSAQITHHYSKEELLGKQIVAVINFPKKQIANFLSECLILGIYGELKEVTLLTPTNTVKNGFQVG